MKRILDFNIADPNFLANPYSTYEKIHNENYVLKDQKLGAFFFGHYEDVQQILSQQDLFTTEPLAKRAEPVMGDRVLAQMHGNEHHNKRKNILSGLTGTIFRDKYKSIIYEITVKLVKNKLMIGEIDLINDFGKDYSILVTLNVLGLPTERYKDIAYWHSGISIFITSLFLTEEERNFSLDCSDKLISYLSPIIDEIMRHPKDCLISKICLTKDNEMTKSEIIALVLNVLLAATEPADKTLAYLFYNLIKNEGLLKNILADRSLLKSAVNETLRLNSPVQLIPRQTKQDVTLSGIYVPKNSIVFCMIGSANRDPSVFDNPDHFILNRKLLVKENLGKSANHLAFGVGMHVCVGAAFASMQIELTANILLDHLKDLHIDNKYILVEKGLYTRGPLSMNIKFNPCVSKER